MINKTDLRIGNSVMLNGKILTVKAIEHNPVNDRWYIKVYENYTQIKCEYLEPIPITEEALVKMGFTKSEELDYRFRLKVEHDSGFIIYDLDDNMYSIHDSWINTRIKYVHQLCNLIYSLTQTELTYEP